MKAGALLLCALVLTAEVAHAADLNQAGLRALRQGDVGRAAALFRKAAAQEGDGGEALTNLGQALSRLGRRAEAEETFRRAIAARPGQWRAYAGLAELLAEDPRRFTMREEVLGLLQAGIAQLGTDAEGRTNLALSAAYFERAVGRNQDARKRLRALDGTTLTTEQQGRVLDLTDRLQTEERARTLLDWPEPRVPEGASITLARAEEALGRGAIGVAQAEAARLAGSFPGWRAPRWLLARALEEAGRFDDAGRELTVLVNLAPSNAAAWRRLGRILALHGGITDTVRADEALRHALAIDPSAFDLWLLRAQLALRNGKPDDAARALDHYLRQAPERASEAEVARLRTQIGATQAQPARPHASRSSFAATDRAREMYRQALDWISIGDPGEMAPALLAGALLESPGYIEAAVKSFSLTQQMPERTVKALWDDGEALLELARQVRSLKDNAAMRAVVRPWLDQAVRLGVVAARLDRGLLRIEDDDRPGGIVDLLHYVSSESDPKAPGLDEARAQLSTTAPQDPARVLARVKLLDDRPREAAEILGGRCDKDTPAERLIGLGVVFEWAGEAERAIGCYQESLRRSPTAIEPLERLAGLGARTRLALVMPLQAELSRAAAQHITAAEWALARLHLARGERDLALDRVQRFLREASPEDPHLHTAQAARADLLRAHDEERHRQRLRQAMTGGGLVLLVLLVLLLRFRGAPLARALQRRPAIFPEVARAIGELRHDVLKHRTSVLGLVAEGDARAEVARMLWEPQRASVVIATAYESLRQTAQARGATLRRLPREPVFGPLCRDLRRAEVLVRRPMLGPRAAETLRRIDARLRELHAERLGALLRLAPRTPLSAPLLAGWVRLVEDELRLSQERWTSPVLHLGALDLEFPVERGALLTIFTNLLRNAQRAAHAPAGGGGVIVRVNEERDITGRRMLVLLVGDTAPATLTLEAIERRESGRGLALVRDLVHEWQGHLIIRAEAAPWSKGVGACFPI